MTETTSELKVPGIDSFFRGLPWVIAILVFSFLSWLVWERFFQLFMDPVWAQFAALGMGTQGAFAVTLLALAGNWPFSNIQSRWGRGISLTILSIVIAALFWLLLGGVFKLNLEKWAFPIIANSWFFIAATSFIGGDAHLKDTPAKRRMFLNLLIITAGTAFVMSTVNWIPPFWFGLLETTLITGLPLYLFRRVKQPTFSLLGWSLIVVELLILIVVATALGYWTWPVASAKGWLWAIGAPTPEFGVFFALTGGFNFSVLACIQCWPFCRIRQPWGALVAFPVFFGILALLASLIISFMKTMVPEANVMWQSMILAWQTVVWGWAWVYFFGAGSSPYLWKGQKTPGTWDDVD